MNGDDDDEDDDNNDDDDNDDGAATRDLAFQTFFFLGFLFCSHFISFWALSLVFSCRNFLTLGAQGQYIFAWAKKPRSIGANVPGAWLQFSSSWTFYERLNKSGVTMIK